MANKLLLPENVIWTLAILGAVFTVFRVSFDFTSFGIPLILGNFLTYTALLCSFIVAIVLIIDVFKNDVSGKYLWTLAFLLSGGITGLFYLRSRAKNFKNY